MFSNRLYFCSKAEGEALADGEEEAPPPAPPPPQPLAADCESMEKKFPNALPLRGIKHICDNLMKAALESMDE